MNNLKSCPFCGGIAKLNAPGYEYYSPYWCKCTRCGAEGPTKSSELEAEKGWNERVRDDVEHTPIICKDCIKRKTDSCLMYWNGIFDDETWDDNWYCADGERKESCEAE